MTNDYLTDDLGFPPLDSVDDIPTGPESEDYIIGDEPRGYFVGVVEGKSIGHFKTYSEAQLAVRADMDASQFWPNVWHISDHGNAELVQLTV